MQNYSPPPKEQVLNVGSDILTGQIHQNLNSWQTKKKKAKKKTEALRMGYMLQTF